MFSLVVIAVLCTSCLAAPYDFSSFSLPVGGSSGDAFYTQGDGRISGIRVWENPNSYITGLQVRYGTTWSPTIGREVGTAQELLLQGHEAITQYSFNMFPQYRGAVLKTLHGRVNSAGITSLGAQWGMFYFSNAYFHE
ncbi:zymogen granule membrane protein 16-like [Salarias fasciatus]|uniref:zymogen granule membrane protein 16-like n=1 Tax=Salarias fasciatus TaxID=181472 RepID=UPI001176887B|nr:zymogen granule membrane protein 16-like [Salarias fasciatus]